ncbi:hypothetical protein U91I_00537 [alpha proteobacterium U9-1i]|nr:hypothetical protein U91I_00537 [alpha proteobacterium U9-1i]
MILNSATSHYASRVLMPHRILLTMIVAWTATALCHPNALALTCIDTTRAAQIAEADAIFRGRPISSQFLTDAAPPLPPTRPPASLQDGWDGDFIVHTFEIFDVLKGDLGLFAQIYEHVSCMTCDLGIRPGQVLLVFASRREGGRLVASPCGDVQEDAIGANARWITEQMLESQRQ